MTSFSAKKIVFVAFPGVKTLDLAGPLQVFSDAKQGAARYAETIIVSKNGGLVNSDTVLPVPTSPLVDLLNTPIDTLIILGGNGDIKASEDQDFISGIQKLAAQSRRIASVCTGAFILAHAGLLHRRKAATHWQYCDQLQDMFPETAVEADAIFVQDGNVWTSAGVTAGIDMALAMVAEDLGRETALTLARALVCYMARPGGQSQFSAPLQHQFSAKSHRFETLNHWISHNLNQVLSVESLAKQAAMSPRNFARLYKSHCGKSPAKAVEAMRIDAACRLLEDTQLPLISVAKQSGFIDDERLRRAMMRAVKIAPGEYRQRFGARS